MNPTILGPRWLPALAMALATGLAAAGRAAPVVEQGVPFIQDPNDVGERAQMFFAVTLEAGTKKLTGTLAVDSGFTGDVLLLPEYATRLGDAGQVRLRFAKSPETFDGVAVIPMDHPGIRMCARDTKVVFGDKPMMGIVGFGILKQRIVSIDFQRQRLFFRPLDSKRRTFRDAAPLAEAEYRFRNALLCPVVINQTNEGLVQIDTGTSVGALLDKSVGEVKSFVIGGRDFIKDLPKPESDDIGGMSMMFGEGFIGQVGCPFLEHVLLTIDPAKHKLYFEKPSDPLPGSARPRRQALAPLKAGMPWIGVELTDSPAEDGKAGVRVVDVAPDGPAMQAGLQAGDLIERVDDQPARTRRDVADTVRARRPGEELRFTVTRQGKSRQLVVKVKSFAPVEKTPRAP
jgi:hypothetical protein